MRILDIIIEYATPEDPQIREIRYNQKFKILEYVGEKNMKFDILKDSTPYIKNTIVNVGETIIIQTGENGIISLMIQFLN